MLCQKQVSKAGASNCTHKCYGMWLLVPALDTRFWYNTPHSILWLYADLISPPCPNLTAGLVNVWQQKLYDDVIMGAMVSQITRLTIVYSTVYLGSDKKNPSKFRVTDLCAGNWPVTGDIPSQMASNAENVSIWWRHHDAPEVPYGITLIAASNTRDEIQQIGIQWMIYLYREINFTP